MLWAGAGKSLISHGYGKVSNSYLNHGVDLQASIRYHSDRYTEMLYGNMVLLIQAIERACFGGQGQAFRCPERSCEAQFVNGREWAVHAVKTWDYIKVEIPALYKEEWARRQDMVERARQEHEHDAIEKLYERYRMADDQEREAMKRAFLEQPERDPEYARRKPVRENNIWKMFMTAIQEEDAGGPKR